MADYSQPDSIDRRVRYFNGQFLKEQDFIDEQRYHLDRQRRLSRLLYTPGIVGGLEITIVPGTRVKVSKGTALDALGQQIVLPDDSEVIELDQFKDPTSTTTVLLAIAYAEEEADAPQGGASPRWRERPQVVAFLEGASDAPLETTHPRLARLKIGLQGAVTADASYTPARSGLKLGGHLSVSGTTTLTESLTVGAAANLNSGLTVGGSTALGGGLTVGGAATLNRGLSVTDGHVGVGASASTRTTVVITDVMQDAPRIMLSGQEFYQPHNASQEGLALVVGVNRHDNRQLWIADSATLARNGSNVVLRIGAGAIAYIDALATNGETLKQLRVGNAGGVALAPSGGNVGIGTTTPQNTLAVAGGAAIGSGYAATNAAPTDGLLVQGNVGIGTPTPQSKLAVAGGVSVGSSYAATNAAPVNGLLVQGNVGIGTSSTAFKMTVQASQQHLQLKRGSQETSGGKFLGLELYQEDTTSLSVPETSLAIRFHHAGRFWHRMEAESRGFSFRSGDLASDTLSNVYAAGFVGHGAVVVGMIVMWHGNISQIPTGWYLCDGNNNTPDLRDRFVVGAGRHYAFQNQGGASRVTLTIAEMPKHNHNAGGYQYLLASDEKYTVNEWDNSQGEPNLKDKGVIQEAGGDQSHENMPPYYALAFIMKAPW